MIIGCQYDPFASDLTTHKPKLKDIVGKYKFERQTVGADSISKRSNKSTIILYADSTFKAFNIPNFDDETYVGRLSITGKWQMDIIDGVNDGDGVKDEWGISVTGVPRSIQYIGFMGEKAPYGLIITYGDSDKGAVMIFKKE